MNVQKHLDKVIKVEPDDALYYKWSPAEWKYDSIESKKLDQLSKQLMEVATSISDNDFVKHRSQIFERCVIVLKKHKQAKLFDKVANNFVLMFDVSDYSDEKQQVKWIEELNTVELAKEFEKVITEE